MAASAYSHSSLCISSNDTYQNLTICPKHCKFQVMINHNGVSFQPRKYVKNRNHPSRLRVLCLREPRATVVTGKSWETLVLNCETTVLVEFYASWCGPCQMVHRVIEEIASEYSGRLKCYVLNAENDLQVAENYDVKAVPVVLLFKNGEKHASIVGTMPKEFYVAAIERILALESRIN